MEDNHPIPMSAWREGWEATRQAHHRITFFYGVDVMMGALGGFVGTLALPAEPSLLQQALYPAVGTVIGVVVSVFILFLVFSGAAYVRRRMTIMVTNIVTHVSIQNNVTVASPYLTPVILSDAEQGISALRYLLNRGTELEPDVSPTGVHRWGWGQMEYWTQQWLDRVAEGVWQYIPDQATYIMSDEGLQLRDEVLKYEGWQSPLAVRRVVFDRRLGRLRQVCSQIPKLHMADSEPEEGV